MLPTCPNIGVHLFRHKPKIIDQSQILNAYWVYLPICLNEAKQIHLIGYSGMDNHLNEVLKKYVNHKQINVIEWEGSCEGSTSTSMLERLNFWKEKLYSYNGNIKLIHAEDILAGPYKVYEEKNRRLLTVTPDPNDFPRFMNG